MRVDNGTGPGNGSLVPREGSPEEEEPPRPPWVASTLAAVLIFTIVVDVLGNLLVILSVYRNKKLRNADVFGTSSGYLGKQWKTGETLQDQFHFLKTID